MRILPDCQRACQHYNELTEVEKVKAIHWIDIGFSDHGAASLTGLSVAMVREILARRVSDGFGEAS